MKNQVLSTLLLACACGSTNARQTTAPVSASVRAPDGVPISCDVRGTGTTGLVFIHGWCCDHTFWLGQLDVFAADYRVVSLDLGGHGASGANRETWSVRGLAGDVQAVVDALPLERVILVGHSMGGPVSLFAAARMPEKVVAVIGVDTLHNVEIQFPKELAAQLEEKFRDDFRGTMTQFVQSTFAEGADPSVVKWTIGKACAANTTAAIGLFRDFENLELAKALEAAKVPVRCINAAPRPPLGMPTDVEANRRHGDFDVVIMEGVGHFPMLEKPAEFNAKLRSVLAHLPQRKPGEGH